MAVSSVMVMDGAGSMDGLCEGEGVETTSRWLQGLLPRGFVARSSAPYVVAARSCVAAKCVMVEARLKFAITDPVLARGPWVMSNV